MQNWDYFDNIDNGKQFDLLDEEGQLESVANNIGSYLYEYKPEAQELYGVDGQNHLGIIAQDLLRVPGLDSAVHTDPETGNLVVDASYVSLACLGLVAALARKVLQNGELNNDIEQNGRELDEPVQDTTAAEPEPTERSGEAGDGEYNATGQSDESRLGAGETIHDVITNS